MAGAVRLEWWMGLYAEFEATSGARPPLEFDMRPATPDDTDAMGEVWMTRHPGDPEEIRKGIRGEIGMAIRGEGRVVLVAEHEGQVIAYGRAKCWTPEEVAGFRNCPAGWWLSGTIVLPDFRRRGVGSALMQRRLADLGVVVHSKVDVINRVSRAWHARNGFVEVTRDFTSPRTNNPEPMILLRWSPPAGDQSGSR